MAPSRYSYFFPSTVKSKLRAWAAAQCGAGKNAHGIYPQCAVADNGMLQEQLACGCASPTMELLDGEDPGASLRVSINTILMWLCVW